MKVRLFGSLRCSHAEEEMEIALPQGATVMDLIRVLVERLGPEFESQVMNGAAGEVRESLITINGHAERLPNSLGRALHEGDEVAFLGFCAGG